MHSLGEYIGAQRTIQGDLQITLTIDENALERLESLKGKELSIDIEEYRETRSNRANRYLWKLCDLIAQTLGSSKETIYIMKLKDYGVFDDYAIPKERVKDFSKLWRYTEVIYEYEVERAEGVMLQMVEMRCYKGSHEYDTKQMSKLLQGIVNDAHDIGIETWSDAEVVSAIKAWKGY